MFDFFDFLYGWFVSGIYTFMKDFFSWSLQKMLIAYYEASVWSIQFAWDIASDVIDELNLSAEITTAFSTLTPISSQALAFFRIPECINIILSAFGTRFVLKFIPFV